jgi:hypothetical protein
VPRVTRVVDLRVGELNPLNDFVDSHAMDLPGGPILRQNEQFAGLVSSRRLPGDMPGCGTQPPTTEELS